ncbi:MAG: RNA polymerase factor sigma-54, partial [Geminicoccaceae bacterium]
MSISLRLDLRQSQSLVMTPQLQQAIKLLQLGNLELAAYVQQELEQNPFLEHQDEPGDPPSASDQRSESAPGDDGQGQLSGSPEFVTDENSTGDGWSGSNEDGWRDAEQNAPLNGVGIDSVGYIGSGGSMDFGGDGDSLEARSARPKTLHDHLSEQMAVELPPGSERLIGYHLVDLVDDAGYVRGDLEELAGRLGCSLDDVLDVLKRLQRFDPPGVFARTLKECLALQLRDLDRLDPAMETLLEHLDALARADIAQLHKICGVLADDIPEMIAEIKALKPRPGDDFADATIDSVVPDIFILPVANGWRVELNTATLPK